MRSLDVPAIVSRVPEIDARLAFLGPMRKAKRRIALERCRDASRQPRQIRRI